MTIGIIGYNGWNNIGDDAMLLSIILQLQKAVSIDKIIVWGDQKAIEQLTASIPVEIRAIRYFKYVSKLRIIKKILHLCVFSRQFKECDQVIIGGGSIFQTLKGTRHIFRLMRAIRFYNKVVKFNLCNVAVGPFNNKLVFNQFKKICSLTNRITVRDKRSLAELEKLRIHLPYIELQDVAMSYTALTQIDSSEKSTQIQRVGISFRGGHTSEQTYTKVAEVLKTIEKTADIELYLFEFGAHQNGRDILAMKEFLPYSAHLSVDQIHMIEYTSDTKQFYELIASMDFMICMRLHAAIISYSVKTPFAIVSYATKCNDFVDIIKEDEGINTLISEDYDCSGLKIALSEMMSIPFDTHSISLNSAMNHIPYLLRET